MEKILKAVLKRIKPTPSQQKEMEEIAKKVLDAAEKLSKVFSAKPMLCGSVAKGTWIPPGEIDLFLIFPEELPRKKLKEYGLKLGKDIISALGGHYRTAYTEHPYITGIIKHNERGYGIDVVPCYDVPPENIKSAVDRTPHHVRFVKKNLKRRDDVRLLKKFCMAQECYGADLKVQGFSGYLCELLVIKYGSFKNVIKNACEWEIGTVIGVNKTDIKGKYPLIVIDPTDPKRNVAAALSVKTFYKFVKACREFLRMPSEKFFEPFQRSYTVEEIEREIKNRGTRFYSVRFRRPNVAEDVLYSQMRRCVNRIAKMIEGRDFKILGKGFYCNSTCVLIFEADVWLLPKVKKHIGPNVFSRHAKEFLKHYRNCRTYIENNFWVTEYPRRFFTLLDYLKYCLGRSEKELKARGIPSHIAKSLAQEYEIFSGGDFFRLVKRMPEDFRVFLTKYFENDLNVED